MNYKEEENEAASVSAKPKARPTSPYPNQKIHLTTTATTPKYPQELDHPTPHNGEEERVGEIE
jgi:hypothetical protein